MVFNKSEKDMYFDSRSSTVFIIVLILMILIYGITTVGTKYMDKIHIASNENKAIALENSINNENKNEITEIEETKKIPIRKMVKPEDEEDIANKAMAAIDGDNVATNTTISGEKVEKIKPTGGFKEIFGNDVFLGDSITKGLVVYNFLDEKNVHAKIGIGTLRVNDMVDEITPLKPENIFILCGINDMDEDLNKERFAKHYMQLVKNVKTKLPESQIYVQSILPISAKAEQNPPYIKNYQINECNAIIRKIAQNEKVHYIDIASLVKGNSANLHECDGVHFKVAFYNLWLDYLTTIREEIPKSSIDDRRLDTLENVVKNKEIREIPLSLLIFGSNILGFTY